MAPLTDPLFPAHRAQMLAVYGAIGAGKTFFAASVSQFWKKGQPCSLDDLFAFGCDLGGFEGFTVEGIELPHVNMWDMVNDQAVWSKAGFKVQPSIRQIKDYYATQLRQRVKAGKTTIGIIDSLTMLDEFLLGEIEKEVKGHPNKFEAYNLLAREYRPWFMELVMCGIPIILVLHQKAVQLSVGGQKTATTGVATTMETTKHGVVFDKATSDLEFALMPSLNGNKGPQVFKANMDQEFYIESTGPEGRKVWTTHPSAETKCRHSCLKQSYMNPTLRELVAIVRAEQTRKGEKKPAPNAAKDSSANKNQPRKG